MYGYALVILLGIAVLILSVVALVRGRAEATGRTPATKEQKKAAPVGPSAPAADEPTPARSATASPQQIDTAKKHTPPS